MATPKKKMNAKKLYKPLKGKMNIKKQYKPLKKKKK